MLRVVRSRSIGDACLPLALRHVACCFGAAPSTPTPHSRSAHQIIKEQVLKDSYSAVAAADVAKQNFQDLQAVVLREPLIPA